MTNDLISREALLKEVESRIMWSMSYNAIYEVIQFAPAVDAVEVVHAKWEFDHTTIDHFRIVKCSNCEHEAFEIAIYVKEGNYCPFCGARMDGE